MVVIYLVFLGSFMSLVVKMTLLKPWTIYKVGSVTLHDVAIERLCQFGGCVAHFSNPKMLLLSQWYDGCQRALCLSAEKEKNSEVEMAKSWGAGE